MKKNKIVWVLGFIVLSLGVGCFLGISLTKNVYEQEREEKAVKKVKHSNTLSMMLETGAGTGEYQKTTRSTWPTDGYVFNTELSKCDNGSKLSWDDENNKVIMTGNTSDKCYVYFDVYSLAVINSLTTSSTSSSIKLTVNATSGTKPITKYYYSKDNGTSYVESTSNIYTFSGLTNGTTYNMKVYVVDENGKSSTVYSKSVKTDNIQMLADYVKNQYTGIQGSNGLYLHNSSLTNGARDNSYRYAGANPNNYVCFGSTVTPCPNDNLYRIIGIFGDKVKLIKADFATSTALGTSGAYTSNTFLASSYLTYKGSLTTINRYYWNSSSNNTWSESNLNTINLNKIYLSNFGDSWSNMIAETTWKVGGNTWTNIGTSAMNTAYQNEIVNPSTDLSEQYRTYSDEIGLMYVSDYGYAASPTYWTYVGYNSSNATLDYRAATNENWMYMGLNEWTISRRSDNSYDAFIVYSNGTVSFYSVYVNGSGVRPTFYLTSNVQYDKGSGTISDPILIK